VSARAALILLAAGLVAGCVSTDSLERRGASLSLTPPSDVARQLVGRWGEDCKVVINGVGVNGRVVGWGLDGEPLSGQFRDARGAAGAAGILTFKWPVALIPVPSGFARASASVVGGDLVYTFYPATARLRLTGPLPRWTNRGYPVPQSFDLDRCADPGPAPHDWAPIGALPPPPRA
jgi:hypothetical protein